MELVTVGELVHQLPARELVCSSTVIALDALLYTVHLRPLDWFVTVCHHVVRAVAVPAQSDCSPS